MTQQADQPVDRRAELLERKAQREASRAKERAAADLERLELEDKFEEDIGPIGREFTIVDCSDTGDGFIVLKLGLDVQWNTFLASKMNAQDLDTFVVPCLLHPSVDQYRAIVKKRGAIAPRCGTALATLYGVRDKEDGKK
jgi:hypothetical protein